MDDFKLLPGNTDAKYLINKVNKRRFTEKKEKRVKKKYEFKIAVISIIVMVFFILTLLICLSKLGLVGAGYILKYDKTHHVETENE